MSKIDEIKRIISEYGEKIKAPKDLLPVFGINDFATPYIEIDNSGNYNYVIRERGVEYERKIFIGIELLIFEVFKDVTFSMATDFELKNRIENQDCRILIFNKKEELLSVLNQAWSNKERIKHQELLKF